MKYPDISNAHTKFLFILNNHVQNINYTDPALITHFYNLVYINLNRNERKILPIYLLFSTANIWNVNLLIAKFILCQFLLFDKIP